ncbi:hypothetical protein [Primorskyibacter sp. 2E233]|uniref:hypothetical protein n=1 Tax=Primorskyibacter sp. 2E233 TaxID=3413431 RepID=UPI003BEF7279
MTLFHPQPFGEQQAHRGSPLSRNVFVLTIAAILSAGLAHAAEDDALLALRDALAPGECSLPGDVISQPFGNGVLHQMPCRTTFADELSVMVFEIDGRLMPLSFAQPSFEFDYGPDELINWSRPNLGAIHSSPLLSSGFVRPEEMLIESASRIAPGMGEGAFVYRYAVSEWGAALESAAVSLDSGEVTIWPPQRPSILEELGLSFDLNGFDVLASPDWSLKTPREIVAMLDVDFPSLEEGRPRMQVAMEQSGDKVAANVLDFGWADDSVAGQVYRVLMEKRGDEWAVTELGRANVCQRGTPQVTTGRCP